MCCIRVKDFFTLLCILANNHSVSVSGDEDDGSEQCSPLGGVVHHRLCPAVHLCHCSHGHFKVRPGVAPQRSLHHLAVPYHLCRGYYHVLVRLLAQCTMCTASRIMFSTEQEGDTLTTGSKVSFAQTSNISTGVHEINYELKCYVNRAWCI